MPIRLICLLSLLVAVPHVALAQRDLKDIPVPDPELERQTFVVAEGFEVNLYAADPLLAKPIQINFDERGRLWVASSEVYPQIKPGQAATDKILILEDEDRDGVADTTTVFADGLLIPTGVIPGDGGAYVANSTELLHMVDLDGDGVADRTRVVLSGFGTEDTHHILHTLRWGPDGLLYFNQSIYIHSHIETPYGVKRLNGGGIWQFRPESMELNVFMRGLVNSWGHHFDDYGQAFATDGAGGEGINYVVPGAYYFTAVGSDRIIRGLNPGSPKHCGLEIVSGRALPADWQGSMIANDFRGHRVCRFKVTDDGSGFASREQEELIKSNHVAFRPIDVKIGPDGAIYIADWYNPIIQHGEVDFRDERRDHTHGRIWRVSWKGAPPLTQPNLVEASTLELLDHLKDPEEWTRTHAKRLLRERNLEMSLDATVEAWVRGLDQTHPEYERHLLEGLWVHQAIDVPNPKLLERCLQSVDPRVRAAAVRVIGHWQTRLRDPFALLAAAVADEAPRVRLEAVRVLGAIPEPRSMAIAARALDRQVDTYIDYALWLTSRELRDLWVPALEAGRLTFDDPAHLIFGFKSLDQNASAAPLIRLLRDGALPDEQSLQVVGAVAQLGNADDLRVLFDLALNEATSDVRRAAVLRGLAQSLRARKVQPVGDLNPVGRFLASEHPELLLAACEVSGLWKLESQRGALTALAQNADSPLSARDAAIHALAELGGDIQPVLLPLLDAAQPVEVRRTAIVALASQDPARAATAALDLWNEPAGAAQIGPVLSALLQRPNAVEALTNNLQQRKIDADVAKLCVREINSTGRKYDALVAALAEAGGIKTGPVKLSPEEMQRMVALVAETGDPRRGEAIFRRDDLTCFKCHAIGGAGGRVGPDLISLGASAQPDYLVESLLDPAAKVKENYHTLVVVTDDGKPYSGVKRRQTDTALVLLDAEDREISIPLASIEEQANGASIMPAGLTEKLTEQELIDLTRFLSELGKVGEFQISTTPLARRWEVLIPDQASRFRLQRVGFNATASADPELHWQPIYSQVNGELPRDELLKFNFGSNPGRGGVQPIRSADAMVFVRFELTVGTAGRVSLKFNSPKGLTLWVDEKPTDVSSEVTLDLATGTHRINLAVNVSERLTENLRVELGAVPGSPAQVQFVSGK